jgi:catechol 2,3-dioxygenase-like lactoylglutathione lyase family enzyme
MELGWFEVSLNVQDIGRSRSFYETLGFQVVDVSGEGRAVTLQKGDCRLGLFQGFLDPDRPQLIFWQGDVEAIARDLTGKGLSFERGPAIGHGGGMGALLLDPDGHPLYFVNMPGVTRQDPA